MNPNAPAEVAIDFDDWGTWTFLEGWNGLALAVQANTGGSAFRLDDDVLGILDVGVLGPTPDGWSDLACDVLAMEVQRGASSDDSVLSRYEAGTCVLTLHNHDGKYNPGNALGGLMDLGTTIRVLARKASILDTFQGDTSLNPNDFLYRWFTGRIDTWELGGISAEDPVTILTCVDDVALLQGFDAPEQSPAGAGDTTQGRLNRILAFAGWSTVDAEAGGGIQTTIEWFGSGDNPTHQATTLAQPAWQQMVLAADSANRSVFVNGDGRFVSAPFNPNSYDDWSVARWGCDGDAGTLVPIVDGVPAFDKSQLRNIIDGAKVGGSEATFANSESVARYGSFRWGRDDLTLQNDADVLAWIGFVLNAVGDVIPRIQEFRVIPTFWPAFDGTTDLTAPIDNYVAGVFSSTVATPAWDILNREITWLNGWGRRHEVTIPVPQQDITISDTVAIRGVRIQLDSDICEVRFVCSSIALFLDVLTLDDDTLGLLDRGNRLA